MRPRRERRGTRWSGIGFLLLIGLTACGGSTADPGVNLGQGNILAFIGGDGNVWMARGDGTNAHAVTTTPCPASVNCFGPPSWSPDGKLVAVFGPAASGHGAQLYIIDRRGIVTRTLAVTRSGAFGPVPVLWSTDGTALAYQSIAAGVPPRLAIAIIDAQTGMPRSPIVLPAQSDVQCPGISAGGPLGSAVDRALNGLGGVRTTFDWAQDGAAFLVSTGSCQAQVNLATIDGLTKRLAAATPDTTVAQALFAPDGARLVAITSNVAQDALVLYDRQGQPLLTLAVETAPPPDFAPRLAAPHWSADGKLVYFMRGADLWVVGADGSQAHRIASGSAQGEVQIALVAPTPAPDGKSLAWVTITFARADKTARTALLVGTSEGAQPRLVEQGGLWPSWSVPLG